MTTNKPQIDAPIGMLEIPSAHGGEIIIGKPQERWMMLVVYRGRHCPRCKKYLAKLNATLDAWQSVLDVVVVSADTKEKALQDRAEFGWQFPLGYGLSQTQMRQLGLYVSTPLSPAETDRPFSEPGTFIMRPNGTLMLVDISNGPAARPDLEELLDGVIFNIENNRPARGIG